MTNLEIRQRIAAGENPVSLAKEIRQNETDYDRELSITSLHNKIRTIAKVELAEQRRFKVINAILKIRKQLHKPSDSFTPSIHDVTIIIDYVEDQLAKGL